MMAQRTLPGVVTSTREPRRSSYSDSRFSCIGGGEDDDDEDVRPYLSLNRSGHMKGSKDSVQSSPFASLRSRFRSFWSPSSRKRTAAQRKENAAGKLSAVLPQPFPSTVSSSFKRQGVSVERPSIDYTIDKRRQHDGAEMDDFLLRRRDAPTTSCAADIKSYGDIFRADEEEILTFQRLPSERGVTLRCEPERVSKDRVRDDQCENDVIDSSVLGENSRIKMDESGVAGLPFGSAVNKTHTFQMFTGPREM